MFGNFVVEPKGSRYLDPIGTGEPTEMRSGWQAIIQNGAGPDFREFVIIYHEVGDEAYRPVNKKGRSEEHTSELQSRLHLVCRLLLETKNIRCKRSLTSSH